MQRREGSAAVAVARGVQFAVRAPQRVQPAWSGLHFGGWWWRLAADAQLVSRIFGEQLTVGGIVWKGTG